jgi:hypothetical protein
MALSAVTVECQFKILIKGLGLGECHTWKYGSGYKLHQARFEQSAHAL